MTNKLTSEERIKARLESGEYLMTYKRKVHDLRCIVAGDYTPISRDFHPQTDEELPGKETKDGLYDLMTNQFEEGTTNELGKAIRTLVMQTSLRHPTFEFEGELGERLTSLNILYLNATLGPQPRGCNAIHHMRKALLDYAVGGVGWVWGGTRPDGGPMCQYVDCLDVTWDPYATVLPDCRWAAVTVTQTLGYWLTIFPRSFFSDDLVSTVDGEVHLDRRIELTYYFDVDGGEQGTIAIVRTKRGKPIKVLQRKPSPYFFMNDGYPQPYLGIKPIYYMILPSSRHSTSFAEQMVPHQIAIREFELTWRDHIARFKPTFHYREGTYDADAIKQLETAQAGAGVPYKKSGQPGEWLMPPEVSQSGLRWYQEHRQAVVAHGGADPYASGAQVDVDYAAEVQAIQASAGLTASVMASDHVSHWIDVGRMMLALGQNDMRPQVHYYNRLPLEFGPLDPIGSYLVPEAQLTVQEDSTVFESLDKRLQRQAILLQIAERMTAMGIAPQAAKLEYENLLSAIGRRNVPEYFKSPDGMMPGMQGGEQGVMDGEKPMA